MNVLLKIIIAIIFSIKIFLYANILVFLLYVLPVFPFETFVKALILTLMLIAINTLLRSFRNQILAIDNKYKFLVIQLAANLLTLLVAAFILGSEIATKNLLMIAVLAAIWVLIESAIEFLYSKLTIWLSSVLVE